MSIGVLDIAIKRLSQLKAVKGEHVRTSVGEALRDINEKFGTVITMSSHAAKRSAWNDSLGSQPSLHFVAHQNQTVTRNGFGLLYFVINNLMISSVASAISSAILFR